MKSSVFRRLRRCIYLLILTPLFSSASVENLKITSLESLEKCYRTEPYMLEKKVDDKTKTQTWMHKDLIAGLCTEKAIDWAQSEKNPTSVLQIAETVRRNDRHEAALGVYKTLFSAKSNLSQCENSTFYSTLVSGLSHPEDFPSKADSDVRKAYEIISLCWSHKPFQKDILEEVDTEKTYVAQNLCQYFSANKINLPAKCKK